MLNPLYDPNDHENRQAEALSASFSIRDAGGAFDSIFDGGFNGAARSEMYRSWVVPDLYPDERQAVISNWSQDDLEMFVGGKGTYESD